MLTLGSASLDNVESLNDEEIALYGRDLIDVNDQRKDTLESIDDKDKEQKKEEIDGKVKRTEGPANVSPPAGGYGD